jgi:hypothetical protein
MTSGLRWRVLILQVGLIGILAFVSGFLFWANSFTHTMVQDQLSAQQISFPAAGSKALDPATYPTLQQYAGQQLTTGPQAQAYANDFIGEHLKGIANGQTYSQVSSQLSVLNATTNPDPKAVATLTGQKASLFTGETLRGLLLNAYGWWQVGQYAFYAAIGLMVATGAVLVALVFELFLWAGVRQKAPKKSAGRVGSAVPSAS